MMAAVAHHYIGGPVIWLLLHLCAAQEMLYAKLKTNFSFEFVCVVVTVFSTVAVVTV